MSDLDGKQCQACGGRNTAHEIAVRWDAELQLEVERDEWLCRDCGYEFGREDVDE